jgi:hypothetical protein
LKGRESSTSEGRAVAVATGNDVPILFFSRRIGLSQGQSVPVVAGGRLTGTVGKFGVGALNIQTDDKLSRVRSRRTFPSSSEARCSAAQQHRRSWPHAGRRPQVSRRRTAPLARTRTWLSSESFDQQATTPARTTPGAKGDQSSYRGRLRLRRATATDWQLNTCWSVTSSVRKSGSCAAAISAAAPVGARFSPRPKSSRLIRRLDWEAGYDYITDSRRTRVENRQLSATFQVDFHSSDQWTLDYTRDFEYLPRNFQIAPAVILPIGGYDYDTVRVTYELGQQRRVSGRLSLATGTFYDGSKKEANFTSGRIALSRTCEYRTGRDDELDRSAPRHF